MWCTHGIEENQLLLYLVVFTLRFWTIRGNRPQSVHRSASATNPVMILCVLEFTVAARGLVPRACGWRLSKKPLRSQRARFRSELLRE